MLGAGQVILVVEDDRGIADTVLYALRTEGFAPVRASTGAAALEALAAGSVALVLLDLGLPDVQGFDLLREMRARARSPIIVLTARDDTIDRVTGLEMGADDYITKPFSPREVSARVRAVLRRCEPGAEVSPAAPPSGVWHHDEAGCGIYFHGESLELTRYEYRLLAFLLRRPGRVFSRDQLMERVWDDPGASLDRTVDAHIKTLRAKLRAVAPATDPIQTHRGLGYSLRPEAAETARAP
jgi:two-component system, OmpR family, catabolic regulation response regulator CreB